MWQKTEPTITRQTEPAGIGTPAEELETTEAGPEAAPPTSEVCVWVCVCLCVYVCVCVFVCEICVPCAMCYMLCAMCCVLCAMCYVLCAMCYVLCVYVPLSVCAHICIRMRVFMCGSVIDIAMRYCDILVKLLRIVESENP